MISASIGNKPQSFTPMKTLEVKSLREKWIVMTTRLRGTSLGESGTVAGDSLRSALGIPRFSTINGLLLHRMSPPPMTVSLSGFEKEIGSRHIHKARRHGLG